MSRRLPPILLLLATIIVPNASAKAAAGIDWSLDGDHVLSSCTAAVKRLNERVAAIEQFSGPHTFANTIRALEDASADLNDSTIAQGFLAEVSIEKRVRDASFACQTMESNAAAAIGTDPKLFRAVNAAARSATAKTVYDRKLTELTLESFRTSGANLPDAKRREFLALQNRLTDLENRFNQNLGEDTTTITLTAAQLRGIPDDLVAGYKKTANGYTVPVNESTGAFLSYAADESARKTYFLAYQNREAAKNTALLEQAISARDRIAHLAGFQTWADYQLSSKMARTPGRVEHFLADLDRTILPRARIEAEELRKLKADDTHDPQAHLELWDVGYYNNLLNRTRYAVDQDQIRQYFPVQHTIDAVLDIYHTLLGVTFTRIDPSDAWLPEVLEYRVNDTASGTLLGYTYFDLFPRPGKYDHFANFPLRAVRKTNPPRVPVAAIVGNWPQPAAGRPALLSHDDVVTFFHEFGHNMAALLATAPYETLSGGFRQDFVEAPSQMLENFVWQPQILKKISAHWKTGAPLPDELIAKMTAAKNVDYALNTTRQILYATVDMRFHSSGSHVDTSAVWAATANTVTPLGWYPGLHPQASFGHLMGGYDAGYYGYLWSKVYAQDMFTAFLKDGLENPAVGMRYRTTILAPARTYEPDEEIRAFLGRPMDPHAFYQEFTPAP